VKPPFLLGANLPWVTYGGDFGRGPWTPDGGLASRADLARVREVLGRAADAGARVIRWFLLCDGRAGVRIDPRGVPLGLDDRVAPDIEAALALADAAGLGVMFTVFDFHWCLPTVSTPDAARQRRLALAEPARCDALLSRVLVPLWRRFGGEPVIRAWDLMNEPEWVTLGVGAWNPRLAVDAGDMRAFLRVAARCARDETRHPVTVGSARLATLGLVEGLGLDFYQPHWYDRLDRRVPLATPVARALRDAPLVLGEFPSRGSRLNVAEIVATARAAGYRGALAWSLLADDSASDAAQVIDGLARASAAVGDEPHRPLRSAAAFL
jgi:hypothetical protein